MHNSDDESPLLEYHKIQKKRWRPNGAQKRLLTFIACSTLALSLALAGLPTIGLLLFAGTCVFGFVLMFIGPFREAAANKRMTEDQEEAAWELLETRKKAMLESALRIYAKGPVGKWRWHIITDNVRGAPPDIHAYAWIAFDIRGHGRYVWEDHDAGTTGETSFEYKIEQPQCLHVRIATPAPTEWVSVNYGFQARGLNEEDLDLFLWFEGDNPFPEHLLAHWPFQGEFVRSAI